MAASDQDENRTSLPAIALPKGGGAIRDIGEKFSVAGSAGTGTLSVPLPLTPGRSGFSPHLLLSYDSGSGNGVFGFGWRLSLPAITRKTDKGLPQYIDAEESDVFVMSEAEDLVPVLDAAATRVNLPRTLYGVDYRVYPYRPRIEGSLARIERWVRRDDGDTHWRSISRDNVTTVYGIDELSRIADPTPSANRTFSFLPARSYDNKGGVIVYDYVKEDDSLVVTSAACERNRTTQSRSAQRYLKSIRYGNAQPYFDDGDGPAPPLLPTGWHFQVVFDYGDHDPARPTVAIQKVWTPRPDPFSRYRASFEVRTYRRCARVLMFHTFAQEAVGVDCLVRSLDLAYSDQAQPPDPKSPIYTFLASMTQSGYTRTGSDYTKVSMPPIEFDYSQIGAVDPRVRIPDKDSLAGLPEGIESGRYRWADLDGEGLSGILSQAPGAWLYKRNTSANNVAVQPNGRVVTEPRFASVETLPSVPSRSRLDARQRLMDLSADGRLDVVALAEPDAGYFERTQDATWEPLRRFLSLPQLDWEQPNIRFLDLTGDGLPDALLTEEGVFTMWPSLGAPGYGPAQRVAIPWDEERGPKLVLADGSETIFLADMSGDGMVDLVRIRSVGGGSSGEICYWPNLGYGRFGSKVTMDAPSGLTSVDQFDPRRVHLGDIDGSGTADLVYVFADGVKVYYNQSGNSWSDANLLAVFPSAAPVSRVDVLDLLGTGTACLVWNSPFPSDAHAPLRYVDLMPNGKPHLMIGIRNNLGAETRVTYAPSTRFYLDDKLAGQPWITRIPFPVHVVERVETFDWPSRTRCATRYTYHHGHFDGPERELRGFGRIDQWDTEEHRADVSFPLGDATNWNATSWSPPVMTRTWYHTGAFLRERAISRQFAQEYWIEPALRPNANAVPRAAMELADSTLPDSLTAEELREAFRALKGQVLRVEVYGMDGSVAAANPYSVTDHNYQVCCLQPLGPNQHAVFLTHARESLSFHYERAPDDPRVTHDVTLEVDPFGNELRRIAVAYARRSGYAAPEPSLSSQFQTMLASDQGRLHVSATQNVYTDSARLTDSLLSPYVHRTPLIAESITKALDVQPPAPVAGITSLFSFDALDTLWKNAWSGADDTPFEQVAASDVDGTGAPPTPTRCIVSHSRTLYRADDLSAILPLRGLESAALPGIAYALATTLTQVQDLFGPTVDSGMLQAAGYVQLGGDSGWWLPSARLFYSAGDADNNATELAEARKHFFLPRRSVDPFGAVSRVTYDDYDLLSASATDAVGNVTSALNHYRVMQPYQVTDPNGNRGKAAFDSLGVMVLTAVMDKASNTAAPAGDVLGVLDADLSEAELQGYLTDPLNDAPALLGSATARFVYDLGAYMRTRGTPQPLPIAIGTIRRETHVSDLRGGQTELQHAFAYIDGFGRTIQAKTRVADGPLVPSGPDVSPRWVGSGWVIPDNKGRPVREYEPFFSATHQFEFSARNGVSRVTFYDPLGRTVATVHPDQTWDKVVYAAWKQSSWDANDTVSIDDPRSDPDVGDCFKRLLGLGTFTSWYKTRQNNPGTSPDDLGLKDAATKAFQHAATPAVVHFDPLGRARLGIADNGGGNRFATRTAMNSSGKPLAIFDALGRRVYEYLRRVPQGSAIRYVSGIDVLGRQLYENGMDGGYRVVLPDITGKPAFSWDQRQHVFRWTYDLLRRPTHRYVITAVGTEILLERMVYGEGLTDSNLCTRLVRHFDMAGVVSSTAYDFKGNLISSARTLAAEYTQSPDWRPLDNLTDLASIDSAAQSLLATGDRYDSGTQFDALNRPIQVIGPHSVTQLPSILRSAYDAGGRLTTVDVWLRQSTAPPPGTLLDPATANFRAVDRITYNEKGQRGTLALGNGTVTTYSYDPNTFRLTQLQTERPSTFGPELRVVQLLSYFYDPVGNVTRIRDDADTQPVVFFRNQRVEPSNDYTYDALYRLTIAKGRQYAAGNGAQQVDNADRSRMQSPPGTRLLNPGDGSAMANYTERYGYDAVGNLLSMSQDGNWNRSYHYAEASPIVASEISNRLSSTTLPGDSPGGPFTAKYGHDGHGNMISMPHLPSMTWDELDRLRSSARQIVNSGTPETTYYACDAAGQRVRKTTHDQAAPKTKATRSRERLYLGGLEVYREPGADGSPTLQRETLHITDGRQRIALVETRTADSQNVDRAPAQSVRYQYGNHLGSAILELDEQAAIVSYEEYYPYGSTSYQAARNQVDVGKRYRYSGKERDEENDLYYHRARYYAPWLGRWTSCDPIKIAGGTNAYEAVRSNPCRYVDPDGRFPLPDLSTVKKLADVGRYAWQAVSTSRAAAPVAEMATEGEVLFLAPGANAIIAQAGATVPTVVTTTAATTTTTAATSTTLATSGTAAVAESTLAATLGWVLLGVAVVASLGVSVVAIKQKSREAAGKPDPYGNDVGASGTPHDMGVDDPTIEAPGAPNAGRVEAPPSSPTSRIAEAPAHAPAHPVSAPAGQKKTEMRDPKIHDPHPLSTSANPAKSYRTGRAFEKKAGIAAPKWATPSSTGTASRRFIDELSEHLSHEAKGVKLLALTFQLIDWLEMSLSNNLPAVLSITLETVLTAPLRDLVERGIILINIPE